MRAPPLPGAPSGPPPRALSLRIESALNDKELESNDSMSAYTLPMIGMGVEVHDWRTRLSLLGSFQRVCQLSSILVGAGSAQLH